MYIRLKTIKGRRYVYLVEGRREGGRVKQRNVGYLGPLVDIWFGVPRNVKERRWTEQVDWKEIGRELRRVKITFEELSEVKVRRFTAAIAARSQGALSRGTRARLEGEPKALETLAKINFHANFRRVGDRRYSML